MIWDLRYRLICTRFLLLSILLLLCQFPTSVSFAPNFLVSSGLPDGVMVVSPSKRPRRSRRVFERETRRMAALQETPRFTFGVIADIQYANIPDGTSYAGVPRYYRHSLETASHAATHFENDNVELVLNLGDIVDGKCQDVVGNGGDELPAGVDPGEVAVDDVLDALSAYKSGPILHTYGNHELYNLEREKLGEKLGIQFVKEEYGDLVGYRSHVHNGIRFVVLDTYDINILRRCPDSSGKHREAVETLTRENPNFPDQANSPEGLVGVQKRYVAFNGAVDAPQLDWLSKTLEEARQNGEKAIILSHQPILPGSSSPVCLVWNYKDVLKVLRKYNDVVVASFAGHAHKGGYKRDRSGIHFRVIEAALENPAPNKTYAMVDVYGDRLAVRGYGNCTSAVYDISHASHRLDLIPTNCSL